MTLFWLVLLHVLGATVWTGGHLYLALSILPRAFRRDDAAVLHDAETSLERVAMPALFVQVLTGIELARRQAGGFLALFDADRAIDHLALAKLGLLVVTLLFAADVHLRGKRYADRAWLRFMAWHVVPVTAIAVALVVLGVGWRTGAMFAP